MFPIRDTIPSRCAPVAMWFLIIINTAIFLFETSLPDPLLERFVYIFGLVPSRLMDQGWVKRTGLIWNLLPLITHIFLHGNWVHILSNMWALWIFGDNVEDRMGPLRFTLFYLLCGIIAGLTQWHMHPTSLLPMIGASGAVAGVLGAYFVMYPYARVVTLVPIFFWPFFFELPAVIYLLFWFISQLFSGTIAGIVAANAGGVAWWAHVGGFVAGFILHPFFTITRRCKPRKRHKDEWGWEGAW